MIYESDTLKVQRHDGGIAELTFDLHGESVNKFNQATVDDLKAALSALEAEQGISGLLVTSAKPVFIVGADITEFTRMFKAGKETIVEFAGHNSANLNRLEQLPFPSVAVINGYALGGGFELCLACDFRVMSTAARVGLPETKLGIVPGWGGTVRLPRIIGVDEALMWIAGGAEQRADAALKVGAVDALGAPEELRKVAMVTLQRAIDGKLDWRGRRDAKRSPLPLNDTEAMMAFFTGKALIAQQAGRNYPAPVAAATAVEQARGMGLEDALAVEANTFAELAQTDVAQALVGVFLSDQLLAKKAKGWSRQADKPVQRAAVLGAGIMGGGIAYQSAFSGIPIKMKDIAQAGIDLGLKEANKLLSKRVARGRMSPEKMGETLNRIEPTLSYDGFGQIDIVVEAVVENSKVKQAVLAETEKQVAADTVLASNTSTISITRLAEALERPENFCGMHFFNPVHAMPLVEVIRGAKTSDATVGRTVAYATAHGQEGGGGAGLPRLPGQPRAVSVFRRLLQAAAGWCGFSGGRQGHGALGLAHGTGVPAGRGRHRHRRARRRRDGRGLPGPHAPRLQDRARDHVRGGPPGAEERPGLLRVPVGQEGPPRQDRHRRRLRTAGGARGRAPRIYPRADRRAHDGAHGHRAGALSRGGYRRHPRRGGPGAALRPGLSSLPRRRIPLAGCDRHGKFCGDGARV